MLRIAPVRRGSASTLSAAAATFAAAVLALPTGSLRAQQPGGTAAVVPGVASPAATAAPAPSIADARIPFGITVGTSGGSRDTLGLLVLAVVPQSPADRAGVAEGSRVASINGIRTRLTPEEVGQAAVADALVRRFGEQLESTPPGVPVVLEVVGGGRHQTLSVPLDGVGPTVLSTTVLAPTPAAPSAPAPVPAPTAVLTPTPSPAVPAVPAPTGPIAAAALVAPVPVTPAPAASAAVASAPVAPAPVDSARVPSLGSLIEQMGALQQQLHRLARAQATLAASDTLSDAEEDLAALRRRLRTVEARQARADSARAAGGAAEAAPGLRVAPVNEDLAAYFGEGSERGLLVVQADASWDPVRAGDVVLRVDGAPADAARLRAAFDPRRRSTIELLRRRRVLTVTLH